MAEILLHKKKVSKPRDHGGKGEPNYVMAMKETEML